MFGWPSLGVTWPMDVETLHVIKLLIEPFVGFNCDIFEI